MANELDDEMYLENDDLLVCRPYKRQVNGVTGEVETIVYTGATVVAFLALSGATDGSATPIHASLNITLTEVGSTGVYAGTLQGSDKTTHLATLSDGDIVFRHFKSGSDYHESKSVIIRKQRVAA